MVPFGLYWKVLEPVSTRCVPEQPLYMKIGRGIGIPRAWGVVGSSGVVTVVDIGFGGVMLKAFYTRMCMLVGLGRTRKGGYTLTKGEIEEETQR